MPPIREDDACDWRESRVWSLESDYAFGCRVRSGKQRVGVVSLVDGGMEWRESLTV